MGGGRLGGAVFPLPFTESEYVSELTGEGGCILWVMSGGTGNRTSDQCIVLMTLRYPPPPLRKRAESQENDGQTGSRA